MEGVVERRCPALWGSLLAGRAAAPDPTHCLTCMFRCSRCSRCFTAAPLTAAALQAMMVHCDGKREQLVEVLTAFGLLIQTDDLLSR